MRIDKLVELRLEQNSLKSIEDIISRMYVLSYLQVKSEDTRHIFELYKGNPKRSASYP